MKIYYWLFIIAGVIIVFGLAIKYKFLNEDNGSSVLGIILVGAGAFLAYKVTNNFRTNLITQQSKIDSLTTKIDTTTTQNLTISENIDTISKDVKRITTRIDNTTKKNKEITDNIATITGEIKEISSSTDEISKSINNELLYKGNLDLRIGNYEKYFTVFGGSVIGSKRQHLLKGINHTNWFGGTLPELKLKIEKGKLLISKKFLNRYGHLVAEIDNNKWSMNPHINYSRNYDENGFEVIDRYGNVSFQIDIKDNYIFLKGVFAFNNERTLLISEEKRNIIENDLKDYDFQVWNFTKNIERIFEHTGRGYLNTRLVDPESQIFEDELKRLKAHYSSVSKDELYRTGMILISEIRNATSYNPKYQDVEVPKILNGYKSNYKAQVISMFEELEKRNPNNEFKIEFPNKTELDIIITELDIKKIIDDLELYIKTFRNSMTNKGNYLLNNDELKSEINDISERMKKFIEKFPSNYQEDVYMSVGNRLFYDLNFKIDYKLIVILLKKNNYRFDENSIVNQSKFGYPSVHWLKDYILELKKIANSL